MTLNELLAEAERVRACLEGYIAAWGFGEQNGTRYVQPELERQHREVVTLLDMAVAQAQRHEPVPACYSREPDALTCSLESAGGDNADSGWPCPDWQQAQATVELLARRYA